MSNQKVKGGKKKDSHCRPQSPLGNFVTKKKKSGREFGTNQFGRS